ncbi:Bud-site selection protein [Rhizopogon vinicolor AM-OR11-026]|uniref:Bud-site selection protein n=1 Tax=Rhizopogon vinicolor AM-OR11-026 TaxID=1314800 RepID=A0A1B7N1M2_9AGAM|nr:Bud-site selection protein [Rhizopogon vinicolor AM-OR11-026]
MSTAEVPLAKTKRKRLPQADEHHDRKEVRKAAKKAKTFETQKILKKIKDARQKGDDDTVKTIEAQHIALKSLDPDLIADSALSTKIKKDRFLSQDPNLRSAMSKSLSATLIVPAAPSSAEGKVQSRLLSSKALAADVSRIIKGLRRLLNPEERTYDVEEDGPEPPDLSQPPKKKQKTREKEGLHKVPPVDVHSDGELSANVEDEDEGWESGTVSDGGHSMQGGSRLVSLSNEGSDDEDNSASERDDIGPSVPRGPRVPDVKRNLKAPTVQSAFLPSLSVGFVRGDSDTDYSDSEGKAADGVKKNRRGQRARRAIWEKKFGRHANHVMKQKDISRGSHRSHTPSGAAAIHKDQRQYRSGRGDSGGAPFAGGRSRIPDKNRSDFSASRTSSTHKEEKSLHPSWEAKKKLQNVAIVPAQGTRIVFD